MAVIGDVRVYATLYKIRVDSGNECFPNRTVLTISSQHAYCAIKPGGPRASVHDDARRTRYGDIFWETYGKCAPMCKKPSTGTNRRITVTDWYDAILLRPAVAWNVPQ